MHTHHVFLNTQSAALPAALLALDDELKRTHHTYKHTHSLTHTYTHIPFDAQCCHACCSACA